MLFKLFDALNRAFKKPERFLIAEAKYTTVWTDEDNAEYSAYIHFYRDADGIKTVKIIGDDNSCIGSKSRTNMKKDINIWCDLGKLPDYAVRFGVENPLYHKLKLVK